MGRPYQERRSKQGRAKKDGAGGNGTSRREAAPTPRPASEEAPLLKRILLPVYSVLLLLSATGNSICFKKMTNAMPNYPFFLMQTSTIVYVPTFFILTEAVRFFKGFNDETKNFPKTRFMYMALFDVISGIMLLFGGVYTKGTTQMLLLQGAIPITMLCSSLILHSKYEWMQYIGALVIMSGVFVVLSPQLVQPAASAGPQGDNFLVFNVLFFLANIPQSLSCVYKEVAFKDAQNLDIFYTQFWIALYQVTMGFLALPLNSLKLLGSMRIPFNHLGSALTDGFHCFMGVNTLVENCYTDEPLPGLKPCDSCEGAWTSVAIYLFFNFCYNMFVILLIKEGSAALLIIIMTLRLPLGNFAFYMPFIMGDDAQPFDPHDVSGLLVILVGLVIYRIQKSPEAHDSDAPYVITSVVTLGPGVAEPITSQVQRKITMRRRAESIRGDLYTRLGLPPAPNYVKPETQAASRESPDVNSPLLPSSYNPRPDTGYLMQHSTRDSSPIVGVSPVARSAPFYFDLRQLRGAVTESEESESEATDGEESEHPGGRPIP